jgi:signal transduction histidine kinase
VECLGALVLSSVLSTWRRYQMALERYKNIGAIRGETDRLREARGDTKRFMAFLFHEIRVPLSVISLGIPSLRDHVFDLSALNDYNGTDDETLVMEHQHAVETADLMGRSMDVVQRVLGDVLDLLHASTDETSKGLSHSTHSAGT